MAEPRQIAALWLEAFNAHDGDRIRSLYADDAIFEAPGDVQLEGADAIVEYAMGWLRAFPDAGIRLETEFVDGDWVAQRFVFEGTHEDTLPGPFGDIPPTLRRVAGRGSEIVRIKDDKIVEDYLYFDQMQILTQLGLMQEVAPTR